MSVVAVVGMQWGDEGKGKIVDILSEFASIVVRCAGGSNAGHTIRVGESKVVLGLLPSGIFRPTCKCVLGCGMVIDPAVLLAELETVRSLGAKVEPERVLISASAHVVLPIHREIDAVLEDLGGKERIGTTRQGIGPSYQDKVGRRGVRMLDLLNIEVLARRVAGVHEFWRPIFEKVGKTPPSVDDTVGSLRKLAGEIEPFLRDTAAFLHEEIRKGSNILLEGAQGTLLDVDHGTYPYVTSSNASIAGAISGTGIGPRQIDAVIGIAKAYATRVGEGPFPTEAGPEEAKVIRETGVEYGSMTGRPRRCGWLDVVALRRVAKINSVDTLALMKLDVLSGFDEIPVCVGYKVRGKPCDDFPVYDLEGAEPQYEKWPGWKEDIRNVRELSDLPHNSKRYIQNIEAKTEMTVSIISVGPSRNETIVLKNPFR